MTPKEKAKELVHKYRLLLMESDSDLSHEISVTIYSIKFALIAVNELINSHLLLTTTHDKDPSIRCKTYWQQVKQEIEKYNENINNDFNNMHFFI